MANWGKSAVPGHKVTIIPMPLGGDNSGMQFSGGPTFDMTPKDPSLSCDTIPNPYGPTYGTKNGG